MTRLNPVYMKYSPDEEGDFDGKGGYGHVSLRSLWMLWGWLGRGGWRRWRGGGGEEGVADDWGDGGYDGDFGGGEEFG